MPNQQDNRQQQSTTSLPPPKNLIDALTEIQQYYVFERKGEHLDKDYFTLSHMRDFIAVGIHQAFMDSVIWVLFYVVLGSVVMYVQQNYLAIGTTQVLHWQIQGSPMFWFVKIMSFGGLSISTALCVWMSKYYAGTVPKRAINNLFSARGLFLICFAFIMFLILGILYKFIFTEAFIVKIYNQVRINNPKNAEKIWFFFWEYFRPSLWKASIIVVLSTVISTVLPFLTIGLFKALRKRNKELGLDDLELG